MSREEIKDLMAVKGVAPKSEYAFNILFGIMQEYANHQKSELIEALDEEKERHLKDPMIGKYWDTLMFCRGLEFAIKKAKEL